MQSGSSSFATEATMAGRDAPFYFPTDGNVNVPGTLVVTGNAIIEGNAQVLKDFLVSEDTTLLGNVAAAAAGASTMTVGKLGPAVGGATLDVDGIGRFVAPGGVPSVGGVQVVRADGAVHIGANDNGLVPGPNHGSIQSFSTVVGPYVLDLNPLGGAVAVGFAPGAAATPLSASGNISSLTQVSVQATGSDQYVRMQATGGNIEMNGNLDIINDGALPIPANVTHHLDSDVADSYLCANSGNLGVGNNNPGSKLDVTGDANISTDLLVGGSVGIGNVAPAFSLDVTGDVHSTEELLCDGYLKANQLDVAYAVGLYGSGDAVIPIGTNSFTVTWDNTNPGGEMTGGGRVLCTYKAPVAAGPADNGGGAITVWPGVGQFIIYTANNVTANTTISWLITKIG